MKYMDMELIMYIAILLVACLIGLLIKRIWIAIIDLFIAGIRKLFGFGKKDNNEKWHSLEDIRNNKKD